MRPYLGLRTLSTRTAADAMMGWKQLSDGTVEVICLYDGNTMSIYIWGKGGPMELSAARSTAKSKIQYKMEQVQHVTVPNQLQTEIGPACDDVPALKVLLDAAHEGFDGPGSGLRWECSFCFQLLISTTIGSLLSHENNLQTGQPFVHFRCPCHQQPPAPFFWL